MQCVGRSRVNDNKNKNTKDIKIITTYSFSLISESAIFTSDLLRSMVTVSGWPLSWFVKRPNIPSPFFIVSFLRYHGEINVFFSANARSGAACHCCWELCPDQTQRGFFPSKSEKYPRYHLPRRKRWPTWFPSTLIQPQWGLHMDTQYTLLLMFRVTLIVGLPPRLISFWIISSQISSYFFKFPQISS